MDYISTDKDISEPRDDIKSQMKIKPSMRPSVVPEQDARLEEDPSDEPSIQLSNEYNTSNDLDKMETGAAERKIKFERSTIKYLMTAKVILIPIWSAILIVFISQFGGDAMNIIYFALAPFDSLMDGVFDRSFMSQVNGIMINTHKKMFKYRVMIAMIIKVSMAMNWNMLMMQTIMSGIMISKIAEEKNLSTLNTNIPLRTWGELIILFWF